MTANEPIPDDGKSDVAQAAKPLSDSDVQFLLECAHDLSAPSGPLSGDADREEAAEIVDHMCSILDLPRPADVDESTLALHSDGHPDDDDFCKTAVDARSTVRLEPHVYGEYGDDEDDVDDLTVRYRVHAAPESTVPVEFQVTGRVDDNRVRVTGIGDLEPEQAEGFAAALLESAGAAREERDGSH